MRLYSAFWLAYAAGIITLSPIWADRDEPDDADPDTAEHPLVDLPMAHWMRLTDSERADIVEDYARRRPYIPQKRSAA